VSASYDLLTKAWIPVSTGSGSELVNLRDLFVRAHEITDLAVAVPPAASGGLRILYALTARITGLDRPSGWTDKRLAVLKRGAFDPATVDGYFEPLLDRFDLFHPDRPWLQDPRLARECAKTAGVNKLVFDRPSGQNQIWFSHHTDTSPAALDAAEAAWYLLAQLYYGASGRCATRTVDGQGSSNTRAGPLRRAVSYHPIGRTLFETLVVGVPRTEQVASGDACPWELPGLPHPFAPAVPRSPIETLTGPFQHAVLLVPDATGRCVVDTYLTWASRGRTERPHDPYVIRLRNRKDGTWYPARARGDRALWKDVEALMPTGRTASGHRCSRTATSCGPPTSSRSARSASTRTGRRRTCSGSPRPPRRSCAGANERTRTPQPVSRPSPPPPRRSAADSTPG
jgi:CRISPR system Cascade subunit CasA